MALARACATALRSIVVISGTYLGSRRTHVWRTPDTYQTNQTTSIRFRQQSQSFPMFFHVLLRQTCLTRSSRRSTGGHRPNAPAIRAFDPGAVRRKRPQRFAPFQVQLSVLARVSIGAAIIARVGRSKGLAFVAGTVEQPLRRKPAPTSARPAQSRSRRRQRPLTVETDADTPDTVSLAKSTLQAICRDSASPAAARAQAARTLLELAGALKNTVADTARKTAPELTLQELDERLAAMTAHDGA